MKLIFRKIINVFRLLKRFIYCSKELIILERQIPRDIFIEREKFDYSWRRADYNDLLNFRDQFSRSRFRRYKKRIENLEYCLIGSKDGLLVHWCWLAYGGVYYDRGLDYIFKLSPGEAYLYDANTVKGFRNQGVYREALRQARQLLGRMDKNTLLLVVSRANPPALTSARTAGFLLRGRLSHWKILWYKKTEYHLSSGEANKRDE